MNDDELKEYAARKVAEMPKLTQEQCRMIAEVLWPSSRRSK